MNSEGVPAREARSAKVHPLREYALTEVAAANVGGVPPSPLLLWLAGRQNSWFVKMWKAPSGFSQLLFNNLVKGIQK